MNLREWALPVYTILLQLSIGLLLFLWIIRSLYIKQLSPSAMDKILKRPMLVVFISIIVAIFGAHFHLSQPFLSFLAILNLGSSWLSREIFFTMLTFFTCAVLLDQIWHHGGKRQLCKTILGWAAIVFGFVSIFCMSKIYLLPYQVPWNHWTTILLFISSSLILGIASTCALLVMDVIFAYDQDQVLDKERTLILRQSIKWLVALAGVMMVVIVFLNAKQIRVTQQAGELEQVSLSLLLGLYKWLFVLRFSFLIIGIVLLAIAAIWFIDKEIAFTRTMTLVYLAFLFLLVSEILGRFLFYATHVRMGL